MSKTMRRRIVDISPRDARYNMRESLIGLVGRFHAPIAPARKVWTTPDYKTVTGLQVALRGWEYGRFKLDKPRDVVVVNPNHPKLRYAYTLDDFYCLAIKTEVVRDATDSRENGRAENSLHS